MPAEDTEREFASLALRDGIVLARQSVPWLNQRGHVGLPDDDRCRAARSVLEKIYVGLGGDLSVLDSGRTTPLPGDFVHEPTGTLIEIDESQHFTSFRLRTLDLYPVDIPLGFDLSTYRLLCQSFQARSDNYRRTKPARGFGVGGRQRQRAYYDALRDIATTAMGRPPLIRIDSAQRDAVDAYSRHRERLVEALGL